MKTAQGPRGLVIDWREGMPRDIAQTLDTLFIRALGLRYLRLTRAVTIHERAEYLVARLRLINRTGLRLLDVGCGSAIPLLYLDQFCRPQVSRYVGVDLQTGRLRDRYKWVQIPHQFYDLNVDDDWYLGTFDVVLCFEVIEHIMNDGRLFVLLCAHVADNGYPIVTAPSKAFVMKMARHFPGFDRVNETQDGGHVRVGYSIEDLRRLARQNNMECLSCDGVSRFDVQDLGAHIGRKGTMGTVLYNLRHPRRGKEFKFHLGREPDGDEDTYYCIAGNFSISCGK